MEMSPNKTTDSITDSESPDDAGKKVYQFLLKLSQNSQHKKPL